MRRLKEQVRKGELTATVALATLKHAAVKNDDVPHVYSTKTWRWLARRATRPDEVMNNA